jgi:hypothetical protein
MMKKIRFGCRGRHAPAYGCSEPGDNTGEYYRAAEVDERIERAEAVLAKICETEGPMDEGEPCTVCGFTEHQSWCWYPDLIKWDQWQAKAPR